MTASSDAAPAPIADIETLTQRLAALPPPAPGYGRVYRGQTTNRPAMLPGSLRPGAQPWNRTWDMSLKPLSDNLTATDPTAQTLENFAYWFKVIAQHYGPGSPFLDVTTFLEVALWFALHASQKDVNAKFQLEQGDVDLLIRCPALNFTRLSDGNGWLYVFDAPIWDGRGVPRHGELVYLNHGPDFVASAPRVRRQLGGVMMAEKEHNQGDLSSFYVCAPIPISGALSGVRFVELDADYIFPPPDVDPWYARLLRAPLIPQADAELGYAYCQSLGVYLVTEDSKPEHAAPFMDRQTQYLRPLTRLILRAGATTKELEKIVKSYPEAATYICLETPLLTTSPPADRWNQSLLMTGLEVATAPEDAFSKALFPDILLNNVLVEFSPLEWAFRESPDDRGYVPRQWRAAWLVRRGNIFWLTLFVTAGTGAGVEIEVMNIVYDEQDHTFYLMGPDGARSPLVEVASAKPFFVTMMLLRDLSRSIKPDPFLFLTADDHGFLAVRAATAKLVRPPKDPDALGLHFVRYRHSGERYEGPPALDEVQPFAQLQLRSAARFQQLKGLREVYGQVCKADLGPIITVFENADANGYSAEAADSLSQWLSSESGKEAGA